MVFRQLVLGILLLLGDDFACDFVDKIAFAWRGGVLQAFGVGVVFAEFGLWITRGELLAAEIGICACQNDVLWRVAHDVQAAVGLFRQIMVQKIGVAHDLFVKIMGF